MVSTDILIYAAAQQIHLFILILGIVVVQDDINITLCE